MPQNELLIFLHKPAPPIAFSQTVESARLIPLVYSIPDFSGIPVDSAYKEHPRPGHLSHLHPPHPGAGHPRGASGVGPSICWPHLKPILEGSPETVSQMMPLLGTRPSPGSSPTRSESQSPDSGYKAAVT